MAKIWKNAAALLLVIVVSGWPAANAGNITTIAGNGDGPSSGDGGLATAASVFFPSDVAVDPAGNIYISEPSGHRVRKVDTSGIITTIAGTGVAGYNGDGIPAVMAQLNYPQGLALDNVGNLYIADGSNNRVRQVSPAGVITTIAGSGVAGYGGDGGLAITAAVGAPARLAWRASDTTLFVSTGMRVRRIIAGTISTFAGTGTDGFSGDGGPASAAQLSYPWGLAIDSSSRVLIADSGNHRIRRVELNGFINTVAGNPGAGYDGDDAQATATHIEAPFDIVSASSSAMYIAHNHRIRHVAADGVVTTLTGATTSGYAGDGGPSQNGRIRQPYGVALDAIGDLYIADYFNHRVRKILDPSIHAVTVLRGGDGTGTVTSAPAGISCGDDCRGSYPGQTVVTLTAVPAAGSTFANWQLAPCVEGILSPTCTLPALTAGTTPRAMFAATMYTVTVSSSGPGTPTSSHGTCSGGTCTAVVPYGTLLSLNALGTGSATWSSWSGVTCQQPPDTSVCSFTVTSNVNALASFGYRLTVLKYGPGSVASVPSAIDCGPTCTHVFAPGTSVTLTPSPPPGGSFDGWSAPCTGAGLGPCTLTMNAEATPMAIFTPDITPDAFAFTPQSFVALNTPVTSNAVAITGVAVPVWVHVTGGSYSIGCTGTFVTTSATIADGETLCVRHTSAASIGTVVTTQVTVGTASASFTSTTALNNYVPNAFSFTPAVNVAPNTQVTSSPVTITGNNAPTWVNVTGGSYSIGCTGTFVTTAMQITGGQTLCVRHTSAATPATVTTTTITIEGVSASFTSTTAAAATHLLTVAKAGSGGGIVTGNINGGATIIDCGSDCTELVAAGSTVTLTATPANGSIIAGWSYCSGTAAVCEVPVSAATTVTVTFLNGNPPRLANISTRGQVLTGNDVMIAGFIIGAGAAKTVVVTVAGPSLVPAGIPNALANPTLVLVRSSDGAVVATNDNWQTQASPTDSAALHASGFEPAHVLEPAIIATLPPGAYTAIVQGTGGTGVGLVGVYEVDHPEVPLTNISTRGQVLTGGDVMIAGLVIYGDNTQQVVITVAGPSLLNAGIPNALANPVLTIVRSSDGVVIASNDNWQSQANPAHVSAIQNAGFAPAHVLEPAVFLTLPPGAYTAIVQGSGGTGVGLVGVYKMN